MSATGLEVFDSTIQQTNHWLKLMMGELGSDSRQTSFNALRAALHAVRDRIGIDNAAHLGAQLPMLLRGAYYEGWRPAATPTRERHLEDFIDHVAAGLPRDSRTNPAEAARACFAIMGRCLDSGGDSSKCFDNDGTPIPIRELHPDERAMIASVDLDDGGKPTRIKFWNKNEALKELMKPVPSLLGHLGVKHFQISPSTRC